MMTPDAPYRSMKVTIPARGTLPERKLHIEHYPQQTHPDTTPTVICLPGGPGGCKAIYKAEQVNYLRKWVNVILMDPRGCGESESCQSEEYDMQVYIDDIEAIRQYFELERWIVLGISYGSMTAQGYACQFSDKLEALILINGSSDSTFLQEATKIVQQKGSNEQQVWFDKLLQGKITEDDDLAKYFSIMRPLYCLKWQEVKHQFTNKPARYNAQAATAGLGKGGFLHHFDWKKGLAKVSCPTLLLVGQDDFINPPNCLEKLKPIIPRSQLQLIEHCSHMVWVDQPATYYTALEHFLQH